MKKILFGAKLFFYLILLFIAIFMFCKLSYKIIIDRKSVENEKYIETTFVEMYTAYRENELVANDTYKNKVCQFVFTLEEINEDNSGHAYTSVDAENCEVIIYFDRNQRETMMKKKIGDSIKVRARCKGFEKLFHDIEFNQAIVIE